ncbi:hypothetical protein P43SY_001628 [Pythium insidiosum]|uniref:Uncharacterized protein n=1 Tax=Pythium insidiosum TaxID=114742 RepID=A0AAD5QAP0_PYTIN|nr:hypothetical protein P43SY_001628 [Pythium insidiosum]
MEMPMTSEENAAVGSKREAPSEERSTEIMHTRRCNGRKLCSCLLRMESAYFRKNLTRQAVQSKRPMKIKGKHTVKNLQQFELDVKQHIASFLATTEVALLGMVSRQLRADIEVVAERGTKMFVSEEWRKDMLIKAEKRRTQTWSKYMHLQMSCVHKLFVFYTGYRTGAMRTATPYWAFGFVNVDPNAPSSIILPNAWKFHGHSPWMQRRANGKDGEWRLREAYKFGRAPKKFTEHVNEWATSIRPGTFLAVAFQQPGATEVNWWEAQACCAKAGRSFGFCHVEKGHPML